MIAAERYEFANVETCTVNTSKVQLNMVMNRLMPLLLLIPVAVIAAGEVPLYKPSSRAPEPLDIRTNQYGYSSTAPNALAIGDIAPDFEVLTPQETLLSSQKLRSDGPLAIVFYRGHW
ncbi:MAG: hypothetical protein GKR90_11955 [Pseudomonadales bacterium]|nr:hypothetical protein [Pseudomonadales bacterium]